MYYNDTNSFQYADDNILVVTSDSRGINKTKVAIQKMQNELHSTLQWERKWKIKTSLEKCNIIYTGTTLQQLQKYNGIIVENTHIPIVNEITILGYTFTNTLTHTTHINFILYKCNINLSKLYRFLHAPKKVKKNTYTQQ